MPPLLEVRHLTKVFESETRGKPGNVALQDFSMTIPGDRATITAIAGESGSGKTTLANLILGFLVPTSGEILFQGRSIADVSGLEAEQLNRQLQAIFQDPFEVYNPFYKIDHVLDTAIQKLRLAPDRATAESMKRRALEVLGLRPDEVLGKFPHQLSGGQRQRIMVARAFLTQPRLIVADEPVSMVDASLRALILENMLRLKDDFGISFIYITHDLSTAYQISDDIFVLYRGSVAEQGAVDSVIQNPQHPYTRLLVSSVPIPDPDERWEGRILVQPGYELAPAGAVGCKFADRCPRVSDVCRSEVPGLYQIDVNHYAACILYRDSDKSRLASAG